MASEHRAEPREGGGEAPGRVGRYHLVRSLGEGGMGQVHRARAYGAAGVTKDLCIKRIREERLRRAGAAERFIAEARLSMRLTHGNIVPVFDFGRAGHEYFLAMEWVDGADLKTLLCDAAERGEAIPPEVVAHVGAEVARALAYAHGLDAPGGGAVVHRDVKPANILVSRAGDVKLGDFGVATVVGDEVVGVGGTPGYMAPEQARGEELDGRADLYALGVTLAEMLTGDRTGEALDRSGAPEELAAVVAGLVAEDPGERPRDAKQVALALERFVGRARAEGAPAPRDDLAERARRCASRGRSDEEDLDVDTSFAVDGSRGDFAVRMGATTVTPSVIGSPPEPPRRPRGTRGRPVVAALVVVLAAAAGVLWWAGRPEEAPEPAVRAAAVEPASVPDAVAETTEPAAPAPTSAAAGPPAEKVVTPEAPAEERAEADEPPPPSGDRARARRRTAAAVEPPAASGPAAAERPAPTEEPARLNVNALPWAEVRVDGRAVGTTPLFGIELPPGAHTVRLSNPHLGADHETTVTLAPGASRDLVVDLQ